MIIDGKQIQKEVLVSLAHKIQSKQYILDIIYIGNNSVIEKYISAKKHIAEMLGVTARIHRFSEDVSVDEIRRTVLDISLDSSGIIIQLPVPVSFDKQELLELIDPSLDIDLLTKEAYGYFLQKKNKRYPTVLRACLYILERHSISLKDKKVCILGKGLLVGMPIRDWCTQNDIAYTQLSKDTFDVAVLKDADVIFSGIGVPHFITSDMVKDGVVIFDAGTSEESGSVVGDVHPEVSQKASLFTPVPGGIGPLTVVGLFSNMVESYESTDF